jgi:hypothetical protein
MLITPSLLHVKTRTGRHQQEAASLLRPAGLAEGFGLDGLTATEVLERLDVPVMRQGPQETEWDCIRTDHAAMSEAGDWGDLLEALNFADQDRTMASGGRRVSHLISEGARGSLTQSLEKQDFAAAAAEVVRFEAVLAMHPEDAAAAHLLAQAHIDIGSVKRDLATKGQLSRDLWEESASHFATAEELLDEFDPIERLSPLLAATRYLLVRGIEDGAALCRDWYEDWCDLDPEDAVAHATHAVHMMPGWFGSLTVFEKEARRGAAMTHGSTGKAAYAVFHLAAGEAVGGLLPSLDLELFTEALADYQTATGCQHRANVCANVLTEMVRSYRMAGPAANYQLTKVRTALSDVLWNRLHEVHLDRWDHGADSLALALSEVFGPALKRGARISRRGDGLFTRVPRVISDRPRS